MLFCSRNKKAQKHGNEQKRIILQIYIQIHRLNITLIVQNIKLSNYETARLHSSNTRRPARRAALTKMWFRPDMRHALWQGHSGWRACTQWCHRPSHSVVERHARGMQTARRAQPDRAVTWFNHWHKIRVAENGVVFGHDG